MNYLLMTHFHIITLFPEMCRPYFENSVLGRAIEDGKIKVSYYNPRDFTKDKHRRVDERPYGGGPGMVMRPEPVIKAAQSAIGRKKNIKVLFLSAGGEQFDNDKAVEFAENYKRIVLIAGRYEGVDKRVKQVLGAEEVSIGPYILTGGELPAMVIADSVARNVPGVLGNECSREQERVASSEVYTRPEEITHKGEKYKVPEVLLSGDHKKIEEWKKNRKNGN